MIKALSLQFCLAMTTFFHKISWTDCYISFSQYSLSDILTWISPDPSATQICFLSSIFIKFIAHLDLLLFKQSCEIFISKFIDTTYGEKQRKNKTQTNKKHTQKKTGVLLKYPVLQTSHTLFSSNNLMWWIYHQTEIIF